MIHASPLPPIQIPDVPLSTLVLDHAPALGDKPALIDGPTEDLNLMSRRDAGPAAMVPLRPGAAPAAASASRWLGVYTTAPLTLRAAGTTLDIPADCLAWTDARGTDAWHADTAPGTRAWWLTLDRDGG